MKHKKAYAETIEKLKMSHGRETTKRLSSGGETKQFKRKSLFPETSDRTEDRTGIDSTADVSDQEKNTVSKTLAVISGPYSFFLKQQQIYMYILWQSIWVYTHLMQISVFKMQIAAAAFEMVKSAFTI